MPCPLRRVRLGLLLSSSFLVAAVALAPRPAQATSTATLFTVDSAVSVVDLTVSILAPIPLTFSGDSVIQLDDITGASPALEILSSNLAIADFFLNGGLFTVDAQDLQAIFLTGPTPGTPVGPVGSEGVFVATSSILGLVGGTIDFSSLSGSGGVNFFADPALFAINQPINMLLSATPTGSPGVFSYVLTIPINVMAEIPLDNTNMPQLLPVAFQGQIVMRAVGVPEPSSALLLGGAALAALALARRRRA